MDSTDRKPEAVSHATGTSKEIAMNEQVTEISRRQLLRMGAAGTAVGAAALALPGFARADLPESVQVAEIYQLQAAFHRAKTTQDLDLMMSLWAEDGTFSNTMTGTTYVGADQIRGFWQGSGSFTHHRFSLVPSYKTTIEVQGARRSSTSNATTSATSRPAASATRQSRPSSTTRSSLEHSGTSPATGSSGT
jgi:ketosteroid isomerase-like protein